MNALVRREKVAQSLVRIRAIDASWGAEVLLRDGTVARLGLLGAEAEQKVGELFARLSPESRRLRFLAAKGALTPAELHDLAAVDGEWRLAILATGAAGETLGVARFARRKGDPAAAEVAVTVADPAQGKGLGEALLLRLAQAARERGVRSFVFSAMGDNEPVRRLLRKCRCVRSSSVEGVASYQVELSTLLEDRKP